MDNCAYRPPNNFDICHKYLSIFDNIMLMGDFDIDFKNKKNSTLGKLNNFCDTFSLKNLVEGHTCFT